MFMNMITFLYHVHHATCDEQMHMNTVDMMCIMYIFCDMFMIM